MRLLAAVGVTVMLAGCGSAEPHSASPTPSTWASRATRATAPTTSGPATGHRATVAANAVMVRDIDGDTIDVRIGSKNERVRLIGVDTPETKKPNTPIQCYGEAASAYTSTLLPKGTALRLERDVVARDDYGRLLAYVYRSDDALFVNLDLVTKGYARVLTIAPNTAHTTDFVTAASAAEAANIGLWGACS